MSDTLGGAKNVQNYFGPFRTDRLSVKSQHKPAHVISLNLQS